MALVYYNEIDKNAIEHLAAYMRDDIIPKGEIDGRSIEDVTPSDLSGFHQCHFFAGCGGWSIALRQAEWRDDRPVWTGSCPCQPFSAAGKGKGFADERHLWPAFHHLIRECRPITVFGEQVASTDGLVWLDLVQADMEGTGYAIGAVDTCAAGYGAPHIRQRLYWVAYAASLGGRKGSTLSGSGGASVFAEQRPVAIVNGDSDGLGNADGAGSQQGRQGSEATRQVDTVEPTGGVDGVAHAAMHGCEPEPDKRSSRLQRATLQSQEIRIESSGLCPTSSGVADVLSAGLQGHRQSVEEPIPEGWQGEKGHGSESCGISRMDDPQSVRRGLCDSENFGATNAQIDLFTDSNNCVPDKQQRSSEEHPRPTNGFWRDADWLFCRDGKWRAVESFTFPLAHGLPRSFRDISPQLRSLAEMAGLDGESLANAKWHFSSQLKLYGNAICIPQAEGFIRAAMEFLESGR